jgi:multidrug efflux pump subunit AcrA (membrane-fusion protein)
MALVAAVLVLIAGCQSKPDNQADKPDSPAASNNKSSDDDEPGVTLKSDARARAGIQTEALAERPLHPELIAYGTLMADPAESFVVRASSSGTLRASRERWPAIGQNISAGAAFGSIEPRLAPADRVSLNTQLSTARADLNAGHAAVSAAQTAYDRARSLNADNKNVSDRAVQEAASKLAAEQAREAGLRASVATLERATSDSNALEGQPVTAERGGEVTEVLAQPGEWVEQGAALVRLQRFDRLLARVNLAVGDRLPSAAPSALIVPAGYENMAPLSAASAGIAAEADAHAQGLPLLFRLDRVYPGLRPGIAVTARFALPGAAGGGVVVPRRALVQYEGKFWVYVQTKPDRFTRRSVPADLPAADGLLAAHGFAPGDRIVVTGAQTLLSEEFKSRNEDTN